VFGFFGHLMASTASTFKVRLLEVPGRLFIFRADELNQLVIG
jgi:hypothetical protein